MKKFLYALLFSSFVVLSTSFFGCSVPTYKIDYGTLSSIVEYNSNFSFVGSGLSVVRKEGKEVIKIEVTPSMVVSCDDTTSVGNKKLVVELDEKTFVIEFVVKYKVEFVVDGQVVNTQYVLNKDEVELPDDPSLADCEFMGWSSNINEQITDNCVYEAQFAVAGSGMPLLLSCNATYGDSLEDIELPQNEVGSWQFVDSLSTKVGDAGEHKFEVKFVPSNPNMIAGQNSQVTINVAKKNLVFKNVSKSFVYDGEIKTPNFELDEQNVEAEYIAYYQNDAINVGEYDFEIDITDKNYKGSYFGTFEILSVQAKVNIEDLTIKFTDAYPQTFSYSILDKNNEPLSQELIELMDFSIVKPSYQHAGTYEIGAKINNSNFNVEVNSGNLVVEKVEHNFDGAEPTFVNGANVVYGDILSSVEFENVDVRGKWSWKDGSLKILTPSTYVATAVFTPKEDRDYLVSEKQINLKVNKKTLTFEVVQNEYTYSGRNCFVDFKVFGIEECDENVIVVGNDVESNAGTYDINLSIHYSDPRYKGNIQTSLIINKASIANFEATYQKEWSNTLVLQNIPLQPCYEWVQPLTQLKDISKQKYLAKFTPLDTQNYKTEIGEFEVDVIKATANVSAQNEYSFEYNPNGYVLENISCSHDESQLQINYTANGVRVDKISTVGTYGVTFILPESEHFNSTSATAQVVVNKAENRDVLPKAFNAEYKDILGDVRFILPKSSTGVWSWQEPENTEVGAVGAQKHIAIFIPNDDENYESKTVEIIFNIDKRLINLPTVVNKKYTGNILNSGIENTDLYKVYLDEGGKEIGTYTVTLELLNSENYRWAGKFANSKFASIEYKIEKTINGWIVEPSFTKSSWKFVDKNDENAETAGEIVAQAQFGKVIIEYKRATEDDSRYTTTKPTDAGAYLAKVYVEECEEYGGLVKEDIEFYIMHLAVDAPLAQESFYTGESQSVEYDSPYYSISGDNTFTEADTYTVNVALNDANNYVWVDGVTTAERSVNYTIKQATNSWKKDCEPNVKASYTFTFSDDNMPTAAPTFGTLVKTYYSLNADGTFTKLNEFPHNVGSYKVEFNVSGNKNYTELSQSLNFNIIPAELSFTAPTFDTNSAYFENTLDITKVWAQPYSAIFEGKQITGELSYTAPKLATKTVQDKTVNGIARKYANVTFNVTFKSSNFVDATASTNINLYASCYTGSVVDEKKVEGWWLFQTVTYTQTISVDTYYGSVENAFANNSSGDIIVIPDASGEVFIKGSVNIKSGMRLILPYINASGVHEVNSMHEDNFGKATLSQENVKDFDGLNLQSKITAASNCVITNSGSIIIAGELSAGGTANNGFSGQTARNYAKLVLQDGAKIQSSGTINCFGFIDESYVDDNQDNNNSQVIASAGIIYMPFVMPGFRGGTYMNTNKDNGVTPFNEFDFRNIIPQLKIEYGAKLLAFASLYASSQINSTIIYLIGDSEDYVIQLKQGSYMTAKYNIENRPTTNDKWLNGVSDLYFYGDANSNKMTIKVTSSASVHTDVCFFPISWRQNITLVSGNFKMNQKFKLMTGSKFTVCEDATLEILELNIYKEFNDTLTLVSYKYAQKDAAEFNLHGTLIATKIGGKINVATTAKITVTTCGSSTNEVITATKSGLKYNQTYQTISSDALYLIYDEDIDDEPQKISTSGYYTYSQSANEWVVTSATA